MAISEAQQRAVAKYNAANYERVELRLKKGKKALLKAHAQTHGESLNEFVNRAIDETLERDKAAPEKVKVIVQEPEPQEPKNIAVQVVVSAAEDKQ